MFANLALSFGNASKKAYLNIGENHHHLLPRPIRRIESLSTEKEKITVKVGDRVMYDKYSGVQVKMDGEDYLIVKNSDIIAVVE